MLQTDHISCQIINYFVISLIISLFRGITNFDLRNHKHTVFAFAIFKTRYHVTELVVTSNEDKFVIALISFCVIRHFIF